MAPRSSKLTNFRKAKGERTETLFKKAYELWRIFLNNSTSQARVAVFVEHNSRWQVFCSEEDDRWPMAISQLPEVSIKHIRDVRTEKQQEEDEKVQKEQEELFVGDDDSYSLSDEDGPPIQLQNRGFAASPPPSFQSLLGRTDPVSETAYAEPDAKVWGMSRDDTISLKQLDNGNAQHSAYNQFSRGSTPHIPAPAPMQGYQSRTGFQDSAKSTSTNKLPYIVSEMALPSPPRSQGRLTPPQLKRQVSVMPGVSAPVISKRKSFFRRKSGGNRLQRR